MKGAEEGNNFERTCRQMANTIYFLLLTVHLIIYYSAKRYRVSQVSRNITNRHISGTRPSNQKQNFMKGRRFV